MLQIQTEGLDAGPGGTVGSGLAHDFGRIPIYAGKPSLIQTKLTVNIPGDEYEQEADRLAELMMSMPEPRMQREDKREEAIQAEQQIEKIAPLVRRLEEGAAIQARPAGGRGSNAAPGLPARIDALKQSVGQPLPASARAFFEP
ncbi:MAG: hypothetical protein JW986_05715, partial [Methanotrichaceae archaeon]|nr:hypothetical protein [Methanotrichaceae archaeon]